jgi:integrase
MARVKLKYVNSFPDRTGKMRHYFRRGKMKAIALPPVVGSKIFNEHYAECLELYGPKAAPGARSGPEEGTLGYLIRQYRKKDNAAWANLTDGSKEVYNRELDWLDEHYGRGDLQSLTETHVRKIRERLKDRPSVADHTVDKIGMLWSFAKETLAMRLGPNPAKEVKSIHLTRVSHPAWPEKLCDLFEAHEDPILQRAYFLLRYSGQRRSDVVKMERIHFDGSAIEVVQQKTGTYVWIPAHKNLRDHLSTTGITGDYLLTSVRGHAYAAKTLTNRICQACNDLGFPGHSPHGLRHLAGASLAEAGCSLHEIMSILGHLSEKEAAEYVRQAQRKRMAKSGIGKWEAASDL